MTRSGPKGDGVGGRHPRRGERPDRHDEDHIGPGSGRGEAASRKGRKDRGWALRREYRSTYRGTLSATEKVEEGTFQGSAEPGGGPVPISVEEGLARDMRLHLGDEVDWDVQGLPIRTRVGSIRTVEWRRLEPNFFVVFQRVSWRGPEDVPSCAPCRFREQSGRVQRAVVDKYPNVTAIDLALVVETLDGIFSKVAFAIQFMALFTVATGLIVLAGAILMGRHQRIRETVLLRTWVPRGGSLP